jgi:hypothetical protein
MFSRKKANSASVDGNTVESTDEQLENADKRSSNIFEKTASRGTTSSKVAPAKQKGPSSSMDDESRQSKEGQAKKKNEERWIWLSSAVRLVRAIFGMDSMLQPTGSVSNEAKGFMLIATEKLLQKKLYRLRFWTMVTSMAGLLAGIGVNEYCWRGYIPTVSSERLC